jgi:outer membrane protein assembly factor BamA
MGRTLKPLAIFVQAVQAIPLLTILIVFLAPVAAFSQDPACPAPAVVVQQQQPENQNPIKIKKVIFTGYTVLPPAEQEEISAELAKGVFNYKSLQDDGNILRARVRDQWQQRGYFKVSVREPEIKPDADDRSLFIATVPVDAGNQYRLGELRFIKNTVFPTEKLSSLFPIQTGDVFNTHNVGKGIEGVRKLYGESGYINMSVVPTTEQQKGDNRVNLTIELDEGQQFRVGKVEVLGADDAKWRRFVSVSGLVTGNVYNSLNLLKAFASGESDGFEAMVDSVRQTINDADSTVDFKVDLSPCVTISKK